MAIAKPARSLTRADSDESISIGSVATSDDDEDHGARSEDYLSEDEMFDENVE
jgi:hypothetical protein